MVRAYETLASRPEVDPDRIGIAGFSVGGSLALLAAGDPRIAERGRLGERIRRVADARDLPRLGRVLTPTWRRWCRRVDWEPSPLAREVYLRFALDQVDDAAGPRGARAGAVRGRSSPATVPRPMSPFVRASPTDGGRQAHDLLTAESLDDAGGPSPRCLRPASSSSTRSHRSGISMGSRPMSS